jgi:hypothetical protein
MKIAAIVLFVAPLSVALSQTDSVPLHPGARLRWTIADTVNRTTGDVRYTYGEGWLDSLSGHTLVLRPEGIPRPHAASPDSVRAALGGVVLAEVYTSSERHPLAGALAGVLVGAMGGYVLKERSTGGARQCIGAGDVCGYVPGYEGTSASRVVAVTAAGGAAGAIVGYFLRTETWTQVDIGTLKRWLGFR